MVVVVWCAQWVIWCQGFYLNNHPPALMAPLSSGHCTQRMMMTMAIIVMMMIANLSMAVSLFFLVVFNPHVVQILIDIFRIFIRLKSVHCLALSLSHSVITWTSLSCSMDWLKLIHGFVKGVFLALCLTKPSCSVTKITMLVKASVLR